ncbi:FAAH1-like protein [Mya arenaria]|uniref:FAAH1-like protein n=1 Tax=Mya arenaria TaxID=6604 RepID=A0ABY7DG12_MYAAR|nr:FAAH1-like protein [Mya arenaria]
MENTYVVYPRSLQRRVLFNVDMNNFNASIVEISTPPKQSNNATAITNRKGHMSLSKGQTLVSGTVGPMARDLQGLITATKVLLNDLHFDLDPAVAPLKFRSEILESKRPLKIGFYTDDRNVPSVPACARAVLLAKQALETMGHSVVEFVPLRMKYVLSKLYYRSVLGDKGWQFVSKIQNDIVDPLVYKLTLPSRFPDWLIWILSWVIQKARKVFEL